MTFRPCQELRERCARPSRAMATYINFYLLAIAVLNGRVIGFEEDTLNKLGC